MGGIAGRRVGTGEGGGGGRIFFRFLGVSVSSTIYMHAVFEHKYLCIYVGGLAKIFWPDIKWIQSGYILYGQRPDLRGAWGRPPKLGHTLVKVAKKTSTTRALKKGIIFMLQLLLSGLLFGLHHGIFVFRHLGEMLNTML